MQSLSRTDPAYNRMLASAAEAVVVFGERIEDCNRAAQDLLRCTSANLVGREMIELLPPTQADGSDSADVLRKRTQAALGGLPQAFHCQFRGCDGTPFDALAEIEALQLDGRPQLLAKIRDVSRMRKAERALRESEDRLQQILNYSPAVVFVKDTDGRYLFVNRQFCSTVGRKEADILGRQDADFLGAEVAATFRKNDLRVLEARGPLEFEEQALFGGTTPKTYLSVKFPLMDAKGEPYAICGISTDFTGRKHAEDALRSAALAVSGAQGDSVFRELTRQLATCLGVESAFVAICPGSDISEVQTLAIYAGGEFEENIEYALSGTVCGTVVGKQFRCIRSGVRGLYPDDSMFRRLEIEGYAAYPLTDSRGVPLGLIGVMAKQPLDNVELVESLLKIFATRAAAEIERSRVEEARRVSEASYSAIFETVEDAIFIHDWDTGAIVDVNPKACEVYGYSREEMKTLSMDQIGSGEAPYDGQNAKRWLQEARLGRTVRFEWHRRSRDGSLHWDDVSLKRAVISGEPRIIAVTREITDRKRTEDALRRAALAVSGAEGEKVFHDLTRDLAATLDMAIAFIAEFFDGDMTRMRTLSMTVDGEIKEGAVYDLEGTPCETVVGRAFRIYPERIGQLFSDGALSRYRPESYAAFPLTDSVGKALGLIVVVDRKPMTDAALIESVLKIFAARAAAEMERSRADARRAQLEAQLRQAQKMEAIGHLTGGIAHDFNNILTSVMGYLAMASERQTNLGDAKLAKYLEQAHLSSQRARDLIQQMLTFSRGKRGEPRPLSLPPLIKESVKLLRATLPSTIEIRTDFESDLPSVLLDPVQVGQVLLNLCINARDAMKGGGNIDVAVRLASRHDMVCASCRQPVSGRFVELAVADSGSGIQPEVMERMFEPFFTTKEVGKGSGMGLATVHGIVHEHGGHILVDSVPGAGSRFSIVLAPLTEAGETREPAGRARTGKPAGRARLAGRVLVVDDEETVGEFMCDLMESWGLEVTVSNSAIEARDLVACDPARFDLVVTDQTMPKLTGLELARTIAALRSDLPVILYTGYSEEIDDADLEGSGVRALVPKPVEPNVLLGALRANLPGVARVSQA